jgi:hypothetical protein
MTKSKFSLRALLFSRSLTIALSATLAACATTTASVSLIKQVPCNLLPPQYWRAEWEDLAIQQAKRYNKTVGNICAGIGKWPE